MIKVLPRHQVALQQHKELTVQHHAGKSPWQQQPWHSMVDVRLYGPCLSHLLRRCVSNPVKGEHVIDNGTSGSLHQEKSKRTLCHLVTAVDLIKLNKVDSEGDLLNLS
jgi:hypothetical protein